MHELVGCFVTSVSGKDRGKHYVIIDTDNEYVYLVNGKSRTLDNPKKKKLKHIHRLDFFNPLLTEVIKNKTVKNEDIKRSIKMLQGRCLIKEVE
ncbi:MAG: 50S ribosomal protein L14 [Clostridiales bacterium]|nr:50S ribosomal protein L14 [Clostridiales bacterium]